MGYSLGLSDEVRDYVRRVGVTEHPVLAKCRTETAADPRAQMQISPEQGAFMQVLATSIRARRALEVGVFTGHLASQLGVAAGLVDGVAKHRAQAASAGGDNQEGVAEISDFDGPALVEVPAAAGLSGKRHLTPVRDSELGDAHTDEDTSDKAILQGHLVSPRSLTPQSLSPDR